MDPERWQKVKQIYQSALELELGRREAFLDQACAGDKALLQEVRSPLVQESRSLLNRAAILMDSGWEIPGGS